MRVVVAHPGPNFSVADVHAGWCEALRAAGVHVVEFPLDATLTFYSSVLLQVPDEPGRFRRALDYDQAVEMATDRLYATILKTRPHVLLVISALFLPPMLLDIARFAGVRVVLVHTESPYEDERQLAMAPHADLNVLNDPTNLDAFRQLAPSGYFPHAYRPSVHHPGPAVPAWACDFAFVGTGFPSRVAFLRQMDLSGLDVALAGNWRLLDGDPLAVHVVHDMDDCFDNADTARLYRSARAGLNLYRREANANDHADGWAMGPREVEMAACGLPFARDPRPESDELFGFLPSFADAAEAGDAVRWLLADEGRRQALADKARDAVADRTFENHAARLLRLLDKGA